MRWFLLIYAIMTLSLALFVTSNILSVRNNPFSCVGGACIYIIIGNMFLVAIWCIITAIICCITVYYKQKHKQWQTKYYGPYSIMDGGYYGKRLPGERPGLLYPNCGCSSIDHCPKRHHGHDCNCYTCRYKTHKW